MDSYLNFGESEVYNGNVYLIDSESFIKQFTILGISVNTGEIWSNYLYKKRENDLLYFDPIWDFYSAYGNDYLTEPIENFNNFNFKYFHCGSKKKLITNILTNSNMLGLFKENLKKNISRGYKRSFN